MSTGLFQDEEDGYNLEEDTETLEEAKYKLKLNKPEPSPEPSGDDLDLGEPEEGELDLGGGDDLDLGDEGGDDKPFDDEPFDAGVEADEESEPETYIQQLSGKLGQTLRNYTDERGQPDFDLEKFAINSVISATNTADMEPEDQKDIIDKIQTSGKDDDSEMDIDEPKDEEPEMDANGGEEELDLDGGEEMEESFDQDGNPYGFDNPTDEESIIRHDLENALNHYAEEKGLEGYVTRIVDYLLNDPKVNGFEKLNAPNNMNFDQIFKQLVDMGKAMLRGRGFSGGLDEEIDENAASPEGVEKWALYGNSIGGVMFKIDDPKELADTFQYMYGKLTDERAQDALIYFFNERKKELAQSAGQEFPDAINEGVDEMDRKRRTFNPSKKSSQKASIISDEEHYERQIVNVDKISDKVVFATIHLGGEDRMMKFVNSDELLEKPMDYDEPWVYAYDSVDSPDGKDYYIAVGMFGNPQTHLDGEHVTDDVIELK
jgi:hypothetical protein